MISNKFKRMGMVPLQKNSLPFLNLNFQKLYLYYSKTANKIGTKFRYSFIYENLNMKLSV